MSSCVFRLPQALPWLPHARPTIYEQISRGQIQAKKIPAQTGGFGPKHNFALSEDEIRRMLEAERAQLDERLRDHKARYAAFQKAVTAATDGKAKSKT